MPKISASKNPRFDNGMIRLCRAQNISLTVVALESTTAS